MSKPIIAGEGTNVKPPVTSRKGAPKVPYSDLAAKAEAATNKAKVVVADPKSTFKDKQSAHIAAGAAHRRAHSAAPLGSPEIGHHYRAMEAHMNSQIPRDDHGRFASK